LKLVYIFQSYRKNKSGPYFMAHGVVFTLFLLVIAVTRSLPFHHHTEAKCFVISLKRLFLLSLSGIETGGSGGSMNRCLRAPEDRERCSKASKLIGGCGFASDATRLVGYSTYVRTLAGGEELAAPTPKPHPLQPFGPRN